MASIQLVDSAISTVNDISSRLDDIKSTTDDYIKFKDVTNSKIITIYNDIATINHSLYNYKTKYEPIIVSILLSKFSLFLNSIFKIFYLRLLSSTPVDNVDNKTYFIEIIPCNDKEIIIRNGKIFKEELRKLKNENITYNELVRNTIECNRKNIYFGDD